MGDLKRETKGLGQREIFLVTAGLLFIIIMAILYGFNFKKPATIMNPYPSNSTTTTTTNTIPTATAPATPDVQSAIITKYGKIDFPRLSTSTPVSGTIIPSDVKSFIVAGASVATLNSLKYANGTHGSLLSYTLSSPNNVPAASKLFIPLGNTGGRKLLTSAVSDNFAIVEYTSSQFQTRVYLISSVNNPVSVIVQTMSTL